MARALIRTPEVLFLDEPCANLDGQATAEIEALLQDALAAGTRIIMTSHNVGQIRRLATDILFCCAVRHMRSGMPRILMRQRQPNSPPF